MSHLYLVPTPIGNLGDMTYRGVEILHTVDLILAEDTRTSAKLLQHYQIETPTQSYHMHNEHRKTQSLIAQLKQGKTMALISDAGTPGISDPGFLLVREALGAGVEVLCLPGATACIPAIVQSGLPSDRFVFEGFLPPKKGRQTKIESLALETRTLILYESPHKLQKTLHQMVPFFGVNRPLVVSRELTKKFETTFRGTLAEAIQYFEKHPPKGEFVLVVQGAKDN
ncbi:MAG: 16S rRNA (cytidine(1402)-2'-O)-methyltransferase [Flavobacteriaceae bacterium]